MEAFQNAFRNGMTLMRETILQLCNLAICAVHQATTGVWLHFPWCLNTELTTYNYVFQMAYPYKNIAYLPSQVRDGITPW
jgi:hypothetical protein